MQPVSFPEETTIISCNNPEVEPLPVAISHYPDGTPASISCWKLTQEELEDLLRTKRIYLIVSSTTHPIVSITANNPFGNQQ